MSPVLHDRVCGQAVARVAALAPAALSAQVRVPLGVVVAQHLVAGSAIHQRQAVTAPEAFNVALGHRAHRQVRRRAAWLRPVTVRRREIGAVTWGYQPARSLTRCQRQGRCDQHWDQYQPHGTAPEVRALLAPVHFEVAQ